jgi:hypothetical protein
MSRSAAGYFLHLLQGLGAGGRPFEFMTMRSIRHLSARVAYRFVLRRLKPDTPVAAGFVVGIEDPTLEAFPDRSSFGSVRALTGQPSSALV